MADLTPLPGMSRRFLVMDAPSLAMHLVPMLDRGDRDAATTFWADWRARAERILTRKGVGPAARTAILISVSAEVRHEIVRIRGSAAVGAVPEGQRPALSRSSAAVLQFRTRAGGAS
jgi:hypothetical protein